MLQKDESNNLPLQVIKIGEDDYKMEVTNSYPGIEYNSPPIEKPQRQGVSFVTNNSPDTDKFTATATKYPSGETVISGNVEYIDDHSTSLIKSGDLVVYRFDLNWFCANNDPLVSNIKDLSFTIPSGAWNNVYVLARTSVLRQGYGTAYQKLYLAMTALIPAPKIPTIRFDIRVKIPSFGFFNYFANYFARLEYETMHLVKPDPDRLYLEYLFEENSVQDFCVQCDSDEDWEDIGQ